MKKILLSIVLSALIGVAIGQSFSLSNAEGDIAANSVLTELVDPATGQFNTHIYVTNNSSSMLSVLVKKVEHYLEGDMQISICWAGNCYPPDVFVSPNAEDIAPGETNMEGFSGDLFINDGVGITSTSYVFFDESNPSDSVMVIVNYIVTTTPSSLTLSNDDGNLENNGTLIISGDPDDESLISNVYATNGSSKDIDVKVRRIETHMPEGTSSYFCWEQCYPPTTNVSPTAMTIAVGETNINFSGDYLPSGIAAEATISYVFFDENDLSDFSTINVTYVASTVGIEENLNGVFLSNAYPNPASTVVSLDYDLKDENGAKLVIYNLLGSVVRDVQINDAIGKLKVNVSDLDDGIYFYSLLVKNETVKTQKLVVKH
ncbi:MAG: T9SS type A sorting domain-containing protein [Chlorobi bacterium]|nr:T9SS type A sorting domain-containing protein [Chlorobiota bacterium]